MGIKNKLIISIRQFIFDLNEKVPWVGRPLVIGWYILCDLKFIVQKEILKLKTRLSYQGDKLDLEKTCWVNPKKIEYCLITPQGKFSIWQNFCKILNGNWDQRVIKFEDLDVYRAFKQRFKEGKQWEETEFYHRILNRISAGKRKWGCKNKEELDQRLKKIDSLYYKIKINGYKTREELYSPKGWLGKLNKPSTILDEITVAISREGQLLFIDGRHRLSIAKILDLSEVPVRIIARHKKWMDFRKELIYFSRNYQNGKLYQPLTHPDLQDIPFHRDGKERFKIIKENLSLSRGTLLDIGANLGYFCHKFEEEGFDCYAVEENRMCIYFLEKLKKAENRKFKIIPKSIFEYKKDKELKFDIVLALSIFHHFLEKEYTYVNLIKLLKRLNTKELFFESYLPSEFKNRKFYRTYSPDQFVNFIIENSPVLNKAKLIGKSEKGRPIYKLTP